ncbi:MAG: methylated-DNA--[protein]-cysteine S-methyltransferase [Pseudohongiella nitratireducens]|nr:methylated-DNA--[protein]-cysteine S-methyltransferase [Pseudohongiella nitratireducens]MDF1623860.1 methylated-DNA--[protein]-cysteine S-methyltransferase [Pseudohongiella nitratireducens]
MPQEIYYSHYTSPVGQLMLVGDGASLLALRFDKGGDSIRPQPDWLRRNAAFSSVKQQLDAYFAGELTRFSLSLSPQGTDFQCRVWQALQDIPYGATCSYLDIANTLSDPNATRAVGAANGKNPIPIIIPCHRVIGRDGSLTGFGGGLERKRFLLALEQKNIPFELTGF